MPRARSAAYKMRPEVARYLAPGVTYDPLRQPFYDAVRFTATIAAGTTQGFFTTPVGQGTGLGGAAKTELDTNMRTQPPLAANHVFEVWSPRIVVAFDDVESATAPGVNQQAGIINDILYGSFFRFRIVSQEKLLCPTYYLPAGAGVSGTLQGFQAAAAAFQAGIVTNGEPNQFAPQRLDPFPIVVPPLQQITVELTFVRAVTFSAAVAGILIWVLLDGILHRPALP
ncbi:MAG: hypothetical protein ACREKK_01790 [Candidatus Methylomirabilales bacterium]